MPAAFGMPGSMSLSVSWPEGDAGFAALELRQLSAGAKQDSTSSHGPGLTRLNSARLNEATTAAL
jgi:hypothetical protein